MPTPSVILSRGAAVTLASVAVIAVAYAVLARWRWRRGLGHTVIGALSAAYVNSANLGIPIAAYVLGNAALVAPVLLVQLLILQPVALALLDRDASGRPAHLGRMILDALTNPITLSTLIGVALALTDTGIPAMVDAPLRLVAGLAIPGMLLAFGISLRLSPGLAGGEERVELWATSALKLVGQPVVAGLLGLAWGLTGHALYTAVVIAALPTAQNIFIIATRYDRATSLSRDTILVTTIGSVPVIFLATWLLG